MHLRSKVDSRPFAFGLLCVLGSGCAAGLSNQPHGRAAGEWSVTLPTAPSYSQGLAYGKGGSPLPDQWVDVDDVVQPMLADARSTEPKKKVVRKHRAAEPQPASNMPEHQQAPVTPVAPPAARTERTELAMAETTQPAQADASTLSRYEARQSQSQEQQKFAGGDAIVIGAGTLVVVLLVVLLLVLLL